MVELDDDKISVGDPGIVVVLGDHDQTTDSEVHHLTVNVTR